MTALEYFERARAAAIDRAKSSETLKLMDFAGDVGGVSYDHGSSGGGTDVMGAVDERIDASAGLRERMRLDERVMDDALCVLYGASGHGGVAKLVGSKHADVVCAHYLQLESWRDIAKQMDCSEKWCRMLSKKALERIDELGFARVRES